MRNSFIFIKLVGFQNGSKLIFISKCNRAIKKNATQFYSKTFMHNLFNLWKSVLIDKESKNVWVKFYLAVNSIFH